jgi:hypothetical protein
MQNIAILIPSAVLSRMHFASTLSICVAHRSMNFISRQNNSHATCDTNEIFYDIIAIMILILTVP